MPYSIQLPDGSLVADIPDETPFEEAKARIDQMFPQLKSTDRTWGEAASDLVQSAKKGVGELAQFPGQLYGLATGKIAEPDFTDTGLYGVGKRLSESAQEQKSIGLKNREAASQKRVEEADKEGFFSGAAQQIKEIATDPAQLPNFLLEQTIQSIPPILLAMVPFVGPEGAAELKSLQIAAKAAAKVGNKLAEKEAMDAIAKIAMKAGTRQAIGMGALQQGADIGTGTYEEMFKGLVDKGVPKKEAAEQAISAARRAGLESAVISVLVNKFMPGADAFEKTIAGRTAGNVGRARAAAGIALKEGFMSELPEEVVGGKMLQNYEYQAVDPNRSIMEGTGSTAGQAILGGMGLGAGAGVIHGNPHAQAEQATKEQIAFEEKLKKETARIEAENKANGVTPAAIPAIENQVATPPSTQQENAPENKILALPAPSQKIAPIDEDGVTHEHYKAVLDALKKEDLTGLKPAEIHAKIQDLLKDSYGTQASQAVEAKPQEPQAPAATIDIPTAPVKPVKQARPEGWHKDENAVRQIAESLNIPTTVDQQVQDKPTIKAETRPYFPAAIINILTDAQNGAAKSEYGDVGAIKSMISLGRLTDRGTLTEKGANLLHQLQNSPDPEQIILDQLGMTSVKSEVPGAIRTVKAPIPAAQLIKSIKAADIASHEKAKQAYAAEKAVYDDAVKQAKKQTAEQQAAAKEAAKQQQLADKAAADKAKAEADALAIRKAADATTILNRASREGLFAPASEKAPAGFEIKRELFKTGEEPGEFNITDGTQNIPFKGTLEEAQDKLARLQAIRDRVAGKLEQEIDNHTRPVQQAQDRIDVLEATGQHGSEAHAQAVADLEVAKQKAKASAFTSENRLAEVQEPFRLEETGKRPTTREAHTVYHNGEEKGTFPDRKSAEDHVLNLAPEEDLKGMIESKHSWADRASDALKRRDPNYQAPRTVDNNTPIVETPARPELEDKTDLPPSAGDQIREARIAELTKLLSPILQKMGLGNITLKIVGAIENNADASYAASVIKMAMTSENPIQDLKHETIHALKDLGFFTPQQWEALVRQAKNTWINTYLKGVVHSENQTRYDAYKEMGLSDEAIIEEAIADAFADFDANKAPPGMIAALIKRLSQFFSSLKSALTGAGWESAEEIFKRAEKGDLRSSKENVSQDVSQDDKLSLRGVATPEDVKKAEAYERKHGIAPYLSVGEQYLPIDDREAAKYSLKSKNKYGLDVRGIPLNNDGTITVYYHTTKNQAMEYQQTKVIPAEDGKRIYLTNESSGALVLKDKGKFPQNIDGSVVMMKLPPSMLHTVKKYENGRVDMFVPVKEGAFFDEKLRMSAIQVSKNTPILGEGQTFSYKDHAARIADALNSYAALSKSEKQDALKRAREVLREEHNIGTLLSVNGKLEKTSPEAEGLKDLDVNAASMGLGLAAAQKITDKINTCPNHAICMDLCLGDTAGGNQQYGGVAKEDVNDIEKSAFRAGPRMVQYLKTEALIMHPEEFALILSNEIQEFKEFERATEVRQKNKETGKLEMVPAEVYEPSIRLNVTSDFSPEMWRPLLEAHPDVMFYDYTKMQGKPIARNHHLTYSSTGFAQIVDGKLAAHKANNWNAMRGKLNSGFNVAMAFTSKSALPKFVKDAETGKTYQVWDGDNYDARYLDPKRDDGIGMIVGLRNKAGTMKEKESAVDTGGFFANYNPKIDGDTVVIPHQQQVNGQKVIPIKPVEKFSIRSVGLTENRIDNLLGIFSYNDGRTHGMLAFVNPSDFVKATTPSADYANRISEEAGALNKEKIAAEGQTPFLEWDAEKDAIVGHEGRHRMSALAKEGVTKAPVVLWVKDRYGAKMVKHHEAIDSITLSGERFSGGKGQRITVNELTPINYENKAALEEKFGQGEFKYSLRSQTKTPEFKKWFGDSKVVDADGNPLVVYHGTPFDFTQFDTENGAHFGTKDQVDEIHDRHDFNGNTEGLNTLAVYLSIKNPKRVKDLGPDPAAWKKAKEHAQRQGYDGLVYKNKFEGGSAEDSYVAFNPTQIKSAIGNNGQFDGTNTDIRYSLKSRVSPAAFAAVDRTTFAREDKGHGQRMIEALSPRSISSFRAHFIHKYQRIGEIAKMAAAKTGNLNALLADQNAEAAALFSDKANVIAAEALGVGNREGGIPEFKDGYFKVREKTKGAVKIFAPLMEMGKGDPLIYQYYQFWAGAKRGTRFDLEGREHNYSQTDFQYAQELEKAFPKFIDIHKEWTTYNNGLVKMMVDAGVLTQKAGEEFTKYGDYIPFYRQVDGDSTVGPKIFSSIAGAKPPKKLKGSEAPIADFLETIVRNTQAAIETSMKNVAGVRAMRDAEILDMAEVNPQATGYNAVTVRINGIDTKYYVEDPLLIEALKGLNATDMPGLALFAAPANILRSMVTKDPGFMLANMMRDSISSWVTTGAKVMPIASTISNFTSELAGLNPLTAKLRRAGLGGGYDLAGDMETSGRELGKAIRKVSKHRTSMEKAATPFTGVWQALEHGSNASEMATRAAVYEATLKRTGNEAEAIYQAMEVLNFDRRGSSAVVRVLTALVPFLNARMQGLDLLYRAGTGKLNTENAKQVQKNFIARSAVIFALTAMYWWLTHDDDDYLKQEQQTRDDNWLIPKLGIKIPIPFELGILFKVIPERILEYYFGKDTGKDFMDSMKRGLGSTLSVNMPQIALPIYENITNHSFFTGRPIVPRALENLDPQQQRDPYTSGIAKRLGEVTGFSPMKIDHLIGGYFGTFGGYAATMLNAVFDGNDPSRASLRMEQMPFFKRFMLDKDAKGYVTEFYELQHETDAMVRTINILERDGRFDELTEYQQGHLSTLATKEYVLALNKTMKELNQFDRLVRNAPLSPDEKKDIILSLTQQKNAVTSYIRDLRKQMSQSF